MCLRIPRQPPEVRQPASALQSMPLELAKYTLFQSIVNLQQQQASPGRSQSASLCNDPLVEDHA